MNIHDNKLFALPIETEKALRLQTIEKSVDKSLLFCRVVYFNEEFGFWLSNVDIITDRPLYNEGTWIAYSKTFNKFKTVKVTAEFLRLTPADVVLQSIKDQLKNDCKEPDPSMDFYGDKKCPGNVEAECVLSFRTDFGRQCFLNDPSVENAANLIRIGAMSIIKIGVDHSTKPSQEADIVVHFADGGTITMKKPKEDA